MEITVAKSAGFCFGVQRAVDSVYKELEENSGKIYTFGPIIHNEQVVEDLNKRGIEVIDTCLIYTSPRTRDSRATRMT